MKKFSLKHQHRKLIQGKAVMQFFMAIGVAGFVVAYIQQGPNVLYGLTFGGIFTIAGLLMANTVADLELIVETLKKRKG